MKIIIATDHAGFQYKEAIKQVLEKAGHEVQDMGAHTYDINDDYPDYIIPAAKETVEQGVKGIILGGSGQGEAIAANKVKGVRAAVYYGGPREIITLSKEHNNANILSLGARFMSTEEAIEVVMLWIETQRKEDEKYQRRIEKVEQYEQL